MPDERGWQGAKGRRAVFASGKVSTRGHLTLPANIRTRLGVQVGDRVHFRMTNPDTVEVTVLPKLTLAEMWERFKIEGSIDEMAAREYWEAEAAEELLRKASIAGQNPGAARGASATGNRVTE